MDPDQESQEAGEWISRPVEVPKHPTYYTGKQIDNSLGDPHGSIVHIPHTHIQLWEQILTPEQGLSSTCCLARLTMLWWDEMLLVAMQKTGLKHYGEERCI